MRRYAALLVCSCMLFAATPAFAATPETMTPDEVIAIDRNRDGDTIIMAGEAIGEDLHADGDHRWVNVLGEFQAVGVFMTNDEAARITSYGDHTHSGDRIQVLGVLNIGCDQHGGEFDIHATEVAVVAPGAPVKRPIAPWKGIAAGALLLLGAVEVRMLRHLRERKLT